MNPISRSQFWMLQAWASLVISLVAIASGMVSLSSNGWIKGLLGLRLALTVRATAKVALEHRDR